MKKIIVNNPIIDYFLASFRNKDTDTYNCNIAVENISFFLAGETSKFLQTTLCTLVSDTQKMRKLLRCEGEGLYKGYF